VRRPVRLTLDLARRERTTAHTKDDWLALPAEQNDTHRELARAYLANEQIGRNYDDMAPGLSQYIHDAIIANSERAAAGQPATG
jgi:TipAS antibiotic-recognition domain